VAALFTLTVVEPMMVGILGGGFANIRLATSDGGTQTILDSRRADLPAEGQGIHITPPAQQAVRNVIDRGMKRQEAAEVPRV
jgi:gamma-glutamyltranspeptidase/glutathione hydrolase